MYSYLVDDQASGFTSRIEGRKNLDEQLLAPFIVEVPTVVPGTMTKDEFEKKARAEFRENFGRDEEAQAQWR